MSFNQEPKWYEMACFIITLGWLGSLYKHYILTFPLYESIMSLVAGLTFFYFMKLSEPERESGFIFGWNDLITTQWFRYSFYVSVFIGPIIRHLIQLNTDFEMKISLVIISIISPIVGFVVMPGTQKK